MSEPTNIKPIFRTFLQVRLGIPRVEFRIDYM
jgi:hypothetical protein